MPPPDCLRPGISKQTNEPSKVQYQLEKEMEFIYTRTHSTWYSAWVVQKILESYFLPDSPVNFRPLESPKTACPLEADWIFADLPREGFWCPSELRATQAASPY